MKLLFRILLWLVNVVAALALFLAVLSQYVPPSQFIYPAILGLGFEWLFAANLICFVLWVFSKRKKHCTISLVVLLLSIPALLSTLSFSSKTESDKSHSINVMTYNTFGLGKLAANDQNGLIQYIKNENPDVVFLQEFITSPNAKWKFYMMADQVAQSLEYQYQYIDFKFNKPVNSGIAIFSRYPLINKQRIIYDSQSNLSNRCDMLVGSDTIRLINNHLESFRIAPIDLEIAGKDKQQLQKSGSNILKDLRKAYPHRELQTQTLSEEIDKSPYPIIFCGDFNDVPVSYTYHKLTRKLTDSFIESSIGELGHTYCKYGLGIRIDYILHSPTLSATNFKVNTNVHYSDHSPVSCTITW